MQDKMVVEESVLYGVELLDKEDKSSKMSKQQQTQTKSNDGGATRMSKNEASATNKNQPQKAAHHEEETTPKALKEPIYFDFCSFSQQKMIDLAKGTYEDRRQAAIPAAKATKEQTLKQEPMTLWQEFVTTLFLACGVPLGVFNIPVILYLLGRFVVGNVGLVFKCFGLFLIPLAIFPQPFLPSMLQSWLTMCIVKYFSWRYIMEEFPNPNKPRIMVGPPHGVFP